MSSLVDLIARQVALVAGERLRAAGRDSDAAVPWAYGIIGLVHQAGDWWVDDQTMSRETLVRLPRDRSCGTASTPLRARRRPRHRIAACR